MSVIVYRVSSLLCQLLGSVPIGTNLSLYYLFFALMSGRFLLSRGAVLPALSDMGLAPDAVRRVAAALEYGRFDIEDLLAAWRKFVAAEGRFTAHSYAGVHPVACDLVGFFRPRLAGHAGKHYHSQAGKALPAVVFGLVASIGSVGSMRLGLPRLSLRAKPGETDQALSKRVVAAAAATLSANEALICDAGFLLPWLLSLQPAGCNFVVRVKSNVTARRNYRPAYKGKGRHPEYGDPVRPLSGKYKDAVLAATPPDKIVRWKDGRHSVEARVFEDLVLPSEKPGARSFRLVVIRHSRYKEPLVLATNLRIAVYWVWRLYKDRWPIEQLPLACKQMLGAERSFVFGQESRFRLPELALLAGNVLSYAAATSAAVASGFWDRCPRPTCGRVRRALFGLHLSDLPEPMGCAREVRKKASVTCHLKTGVAGHRRRKATQAPDPTGQPAI
jgi:hypothetical protein